MIQKVWVRKWRGMMRETMVEPARSSRKSRVASGRSEGLLLTKAATDIGVG